MKNPKRLIILILSLAVGSGALLYTLHAAAPKTTAPKAAKSGAPGMDSDYGPFLAYSLLAPRQPQNPPKHNDGDPTPPWAPNELLATKGITVKLPGNAAVCFDADTCRYTAGWTGGFLDISQTNLVRNQGPWPAIAAGQLAFTTPDAPGVANPADQSFTDPRPKSSDPRLQTGEGPLPKSWAHYKGLYRDGDTIVFAYSVGDSTILDMPAFHGSFTRTLSLDHSATPITLRLCYATTTAKILGPAPAGAAITKSDNTLNLTIPPTTTPLTLTVAIGNNNPPPTTDNPQSHTHGGPAHWPQTLATPGLFADNDAPYVVDTIPIPKENPWKAWIKPSAFDFFSDGRLAVATLNGDVYILSHVEGSLARVTWRRFAAGLYEPLGLRIVDDTIYVLGRDQITRLVDLNNDGEADFYENFNNDPVSDANYHSFHCELQTDAAGNFYYTIAGNQMAMAHPDNGCVIKVSKYGDKSEVISTGVRAANGMGASPDGKTITVADNQGHWVPASPIFLVKPNAFFGYHGDPRRYSAADYAEHQKRFPTTTPPLVWVPYTWDNSAGSQTWASDKWGPLSGKMLHTSYGKCALFAVLPEHVNDVDQAAVIPLNLKFDAGVMRARPNPHDGSLFLAGLRGWQTSANKDACIHRVRFTGKRFLLPTDAHTTPNGLRITFDVPLDPKTAADDGSYSFEAWQYQSTSTYGSPDFKITNPKSKGHDSFDVKKATLSPDHKTVTLEIEDLQPVQQYLLKCNLNAADGTPIKCQLAGTINALPH